MAKKKEENLETQKITELETRVLDLENQLKRAVADYRNLETRIKEGRSELTAWGTVDLITKFLSVLDYLEAATAGASETEKGSGWFRGVELAVKQFKEVLRNEGLEEVTVEGQFNPSLHEAIDTTPGDDNIIMKVTRRGYTLNGKIIRPAQVVVGRKVN